jgi:hypothetical protein
MSQSKGLTFSLGGIKAPGGGTQKLAFGLKAKAKPLAVFASGDSDDEEYQGGDKKRQRMEPAGFPALGSVPLARWLDWGLGKLGFAARIMTLYT